MISIICIAISIFAGLVYLSSIIGHFRSRDSFAKVQFIKNLGLYGFNLIILAFAIKSSDPAIIAKSIIAIILNIAAVNLMIHMLVDLAKENNIQPDADKKSLIKKKRRASQSKED